MLKLLLTVFYHWWLTFVQALTYLIVVNILNIQLLTCFVDNPLIVSVAISYFRFLFSFFVVDNVSTNHSLYLLKIYFFSISLQAFPLSILNGFLSLLKTISIWWLYACHSWTSKFFFRCYICHCNVISITRAFTCDF